MAKFDLPDVPDLIVLVDRQDGLVSLPQLRENGLSLEFATARVDAGRWQRPHRGVYATFSGELSRTASIWAAILRCGEDAVASHQTAAELDGLRDQPAGDPIHVTVDAQGSRVTGVRRNGIRPHYAHRLPHSRHPARRPPRTRLDDTVLDLVDASRTAREAADWIVLAIQQRKTKPERLAARLASRMKIRFRAMTEAMVCRVADGKHSMLEIRHSSKVVRAHGLPEGTRQQRRVVGNLVIWIDVEHDKFDTRVELDGKVGHQADGAFRDRRRDNRGTVHGAATLRYGHAEVFGTPCEVAAEEAVVLQDRGWTGQPYPCSDGCDLLPTMAKLRSERHAA